MSEWTRDVDADERSARELLFIADNPEYTPRPSEVRNAAEALPQYIARVRELTAEIERLRGLLLGDAEVKHMTYSPEKGCEIEVEHWAVKIIAGSLFESLGDAPNFVTMTVTHPEHGAVEIIVRRPERKTVADVLDELRAEIERLRKRCEEQDWMHERICELTAENDRLRGELVGLRGPDIQSALSRFAANMKAREAQESINEMQMRLYHEQSKGVE